MACGDVQKQYSDITFPLIQKYARQCGADFLALYQSNSKFSYVGYQKWEYADYLDKYDRILHIDADMIIQSNCPNLFDIVPKTHFAGVDEYPFQNLSIESPAVDRYKDMLLAGSCIPKFYINVGMYMFSTVQHYLFNLPIPHNTCHYKEQSYLNYLLHSEDNITLLDPKFNTISLMVDKGLKKEDAYIIHYAGGWFGKSSKEIIEMMKRDIK